MVTATIELACSFFNLRDARQSTISFVFTEVKCNKIRTACFDFGLAAFACVSRSAFSFSILLVSVFNACSYDENAKTILGSLTRNSELLFKCLRQFSRSQANQNFFHHKCLPLPIYHLREDIHQ